MITKELIDFIKKAKAAGKTNDQIKEALLPNGWSEFDIQEGLKQANPPAIDSYNKIPFSYSNNNNLGASQNIQQTPLSNIQPNPRPDFMINPKPITIVNVKPHRSHKGLIVFMIILFLLLAGGASGYYFRDKLKTLPFIKTLFPQPQALIVPQQPVVENNPPVTTPPVETAPIVTTPPVVEVKPGVIVTHANPNCELTTNTANFGNVTVGASVTGVVKALYFKGTADQVSWVAQDPTIIQIKPINGDGSTIGIKGLKKGLTKIVITDNSIQDCNVALPIEIL